MPFNYIEASQFAPAYTNAEKAIIIGLSGGIADYLACFDDGKPLAENIITLFLSTSGHLFEEPSNLLKQELRESGRYNDILYFLCTGTTKLSELASKMDVPSGSLDHYLKNLIDLDLIERKTPVLNRKTKHPLYLIADTMFLFWYRFVQTNLSLINLERGARLYHEIIENS